MGNKDRENKDSVCNGEEIEVENGNIGNRDRAKENKRKTERKREKERET